jgi:hypothetical protein
MTMGSGQHRGTVPRGPDGADDLLDGPVRGEVAVGPGPDRVVDRLVVLDGGQDHDPRSRPAGLDRPCGVRARPVTEAVVDEGHVHGLAGVGDGLGDRRCEPDDPDVRLVVEQARQRLEDQAVTVDEEHADGPRDGCARGGGER